MLTAGEGWQKRLTECFRLISLLLSPYFGKAKDLPREVSVSKIVVSVIGLDCPGVVYAVSSTLSALECNIEEVSQTILKNQFAAIFVANKQESLDNGTIHTQLSKAIESRGMHLSVTIRDFEEGDTSGSAESEPFVVTVDGEDRFEIIAAFSKIFADQKVNIENLKALMPEEEKRALLVFCAAPSRTKPAPWASSSVCSTATSSRPCTACSRFKRHTRGFPEAEVNPLPFPQVPLKEAGRSHPCQKQTSRRKFPCLQIVKSSAP